MLLKLTQFIKSISNGKEPLSLSYSDFFPLDSIIDYKTIEFKEKLTIINFSERLKKETGKAIVNINTSKKSSFKETQAIINLIRTELENKDIDIELGFKPNENDNITSFDIVLYKK
ncbi:MAG: hypothetical protein RBR50_00335 [Candidatus Izemoplasmatales bacterium]|nr:hypothetical protein [Candidatus Izemoplasmatales bacterium]